MSKSSWTERITAAKNPEAVVDKIVSRIEELAPEMERFRKIQNEMEDLKAALEQHANSAYSDRSEVSFTGQSVQVDFTARCVVRKVKDMQGLLKALGRTTFLSCVTFPLAKLDQHLSREEQKPYVSSRRVGARACRIKLLTGKN